MPSVGTAIRLDNGPATLALSLAYIYRCVVQCTTLANPAVVFFFLEGGEGCFGDGTQARVPPKLKTPRI